MNLKEEFAGKITGSISYEEIHQRCLEFIEENKIKNATFEVSYMAEQQMAYGVWLRWESGWWIFKKPCYCSSLFGVRENDRQDNVLGYRADIEAKTTYKSSRPAFGPGRVDIRTEMSRAVGSKTADGTVIKSTPVTDENGVTTHILHT